MCRASLAGSFCIDSEMDLRYSFYTYRCHSHNFWRGTSYAVVADDVDGRPSDANVREPDAIVGAFDELRLTKRPRDAAAFVRLTGASFVWGLCHEFSMFSRNSGHERAVRSSRDHL